MLSKPHWTQMEIPAESQNVTVLKHLIKYGTLEASQAVRLYSIYRLSGRIYDLKKQGQKIITKIKNKGSVRWACYELQK